MEHEVTERLSVAGRVQGVGFRPSVCRMAKELKLTGTVQNLGGEVEIYITGAREKIDTFLCGLKQMERPALVECVKREERPLTPFSAFTSIPSRESENKMFAPADISVCSACLKEMKTQGNRRCHYPYISCTACGPRYTVLKKLPYDRENTAFDAYPLCDQCYEEYRDMNNRRCHGETIACHDCGPRLLAKMRGSPSAGPWSREELLQSAKDLLLHGEIIMVKSVGGYNLVCRGDRDDAVQRLRILKQRRDKPFALLVATVGEAEKLCHISREEKELLESPQKPIVLLKRRKKSMPLISPAVTELTESLGVFLPPFGLYALLAEIKIPLVVTSCNLTGEPIIYKQADAFAFYESHESISALFYDEREILRPADDSVTRIAAGAVQILRRTRGYMPEPVAVEKKGMRVLALGGEVEPSFALSVNDLIYSAQVPSDLTLEKSSAFYRRLVADWEELLHISPDILVCDLHPCYTTAEESRKLAKELDVPVLEVQHHHGHALSVMAEHHLDGKCLAVIFDGTGFGTDGTVWGGEFLLCEDRSFIRVGAVKPISMISGDESVRQAWKSLLCHLVHSGIPSDDKRAAVVKAAVAGGLNTVKSSSMGRLFDAVSAALGLADYNTYQGRCAMLLENQAALAKRERKIPTELSFNEEVVETENGSVTFFDPAPLWEKVTGEDKAAAALGFHEAVIRIVERMSEKTGVETVILSGGCFANRLLLEGCVEALKGKGHAVYWNQALPPGDGGLAFGQAWYGMNQLNERKSYVRSISGSCGNH